MKKAFLFTAMLVVGFATTMSSQSMFHIFNQTCEEKSVEVRFHLGCSPDPCDPIEILTFSVPPHTQVSEPISCSTSIAYYLNVESPNSGHAAQWIDASCGTGWGRAPEDQCDMYDYFGIAPHGVNNFIIEYQ